MIPMERTDIIIYILIAIVTTNLIRVLPMAFISGRIKNRFLRSFLYYVPYVTLAVMTFPAIMDVTSNPVVGFVALLAGIVAAWFGMGLFPVAVLCCVIVYVMDTFLVVAA